MLLFIERCSFGSLLNFTTLVCLVRFRAPSDVSIFFRIFRFFAENFDVVRYSVFKERTVDIFHRGDEGIRTLDPLLARQVLSQLSYTPMGLSYKRKVGLSGLEPPTSRLSGVRSNRLSYEPF